MLGSATFYQRHMAILHFKLTLTSSISILRYALINTRKHAENLAAGKLHIIFEKSEDLNGVAILGLRQMKHRS